MLEKKREEIKGPIIKLPRVRSTGSAWHKAFYKMFMNKYVTLPPAPPSHTTVLDTETEEVCMCKMKRCQRKNKRRKMKRETEKNMSVYL